MRRSAAVCIFCAGVCLAQGPTKVNLGNQGTNPDFSALAHTSPMEVGTVLPGTCKVGEMFFLSTAAAGQNVYGCTEVDIWTQSSGGGGGGGVGGPSSSTDNAVVRWSGVAGATVKDSSVTIDDAGGANFPGGITTGDGSVPGCMLLREVAASGNNFRKVCVPGTLSGDLQIDLPDGDPLGGQVLSLGAPSGGISQAGYQTLFYQTVEDDASGLTQRNTLNFAGAGVTCADDTTKTTCTISGGGGGAALQETFRGICQNTVASFGLSWGTANAPSPICLSGTNLGAFAVLTFPDAGAQVFGNFRLPSSLPTTITAEIATTSGAGTGEQFTARLYTSCIDDDESPDASWNPAQDFTIVSSATLGQEVVDTIASVTTTGCSGGDLMQFKLDRDAADTSSEDLRVRWISFVGN